MKLKNLKDGKRFKRSRRRSGAVYSLQRKNKGKGYFTSVKSDRTFNAPLSTVIYPLEQPAKKPGLRLKQRTDTDVIWG